MRNFLLFIFLFFFFSTLTYSQDQKIGVRTGLNFFQFLGPTEEAGNEKFSLSSGFHFGINYTYYLNDILGFRAELLYNQKGSKRSYTGDSYSIIRQSNNTNLIELGQGELSIDYSLGYVTFPFSVVVNPFKKLELFGGASIDLLISPVGRGKYRFVSDANPDKIRYTQSLEHQYKNDFAGQFNTLLVPGISIIVTDGDVEQTVVIPQSVGAYYYYTEEITDSFFNWFDIGLHAGFAYYINPGLYFGAQANYSLFDLTNSDFDVSQHKLNEDGGFITRDDKDTHIGFQASIGFRF